MEGLFNIFIIFGVAVFCVSFSPSAESSPLITRTAGATLTTAQVRGTGIPKPTSWRRRIDVEPFANLSSTPYDLLRAARARRRSYRHDSQSVLRELNNILQWDYYCQAQPIVGDCTRQSRKQNPVSQKKQPQLAKEYLGHMMQNYFYDAQAAECKMFYFSGCGGNKNNFKSKIECERHCNDSTTSFYLEDTNSSIYCTLQPSLGTCIGLLTRYYYDERTNDCKTFMYGGCGGNQNRFANYDLCASKCRKLEPEK